MDDDKPARKRKQTPPATTDEHVQDPPISDPHVTFLDSAGNLIRVTRVQFDRLYAPQGYTPQSRKDT